jgi:hypothetical protein
MQAKSTPVKSIGDLPPLVSRAFSGQAIRFPFLPLTFLLIY